MHNLDSELNTLKEENKKLKTAISEHRSQRADDRCIEDDDRLYAALGDGKQCDRRVGNKEEMLKNCARFIDRRCEEGNWPTYAELEAENYQLKADQQKLLRKIVDVVWGVAHEDESVPATYWADQMIEIARLRLKSRADDIDIRDE